MLNIPDPLDITIEQMHGAFRYINEALHLRTLKPKSIDEPKPTDEDKIRFQKRDENGELVFTKKDHKPVISYWQFAESLLSPFRIRSQAVNLCAQPQKIQCGATARELAALNERGMGVFFVVNAGGQHKEDIKRFTAFFYEDDDRPIGEQWERAMSLPIPPQVIIRTKKSLHCYWIASAGTTADEWNQVMRTLIRCMDSDPIIKDFSRVMRVPGYDHTTFDHNTKELIRVPVQCLRFEPSPVTAAEMLDMLRSLGTEPQTQESFEIWAGIKQEPKKRAVKERRIKAQRERAERDPTYKPTGKADLLYVGREPIGNCAETFDRLIASLEIMDIKGSVYRALCPACEHPSGSLLLSLSNGRILAYCHAYCSGFNETCDGLGVKPAWMREFNPRRW